MTSSRNTAIEGLYQSLLDLGNADTNPVLAILSDPDNIRRDIKYPEGDLRFADIGLRAYYHSHAEPWLRKLEHGHFHIFLRDSHEHGQAGWSHLAALSVDKMGQPRNWFCVNNWVTGGAWLDIDEARERLSALSGQDTGSLTMVERWLFYMLMVYQEQLLELLGQRELKLQELCSNNDLSQAMNDRNIYDLAELPVDLISDLTIMTETDIK